MAAAAEEQEEEEDDDLSTFLLEKLRFPRDATLHNHHIMSFFQTIILLEFHKKK